MQSVVRGIGSYLPSSVMTNEDLTKTLDTSHQWIVERTGIGQRHVALPQEKTSDLAFEAGKLALESAGMAPEEIDGILVATCSGDVIFPSVATIVQKKLGIKKAVAFDVAAACSGFVYGVSLADSYLKSGSCQRMLVIGAETISRLVDWSDRNTAVLFGDGAGALILEAVPGCAEEKPVGVLGSVLESSGEGFEDLFVKGGVGSLSHGYIQMNGPSVFKKAVSYLVQNVGDTLKKFQLAPEDIDWMIPHQANKRIIDAMARHLGFPLEKVVYTGCFHGNTSAASIPLAWDHYYRQGKIKKGDLILMNCFGAGYTWGSNLVRL